MIYYLWDIANTAIKFGYTTPKQFVKRIQNIKVGNSGRLQVVATHSGNRDREKVIKARFKEHHKEGEWYYSDPPILNHIEMANDFEYFFDVFENQLAKGIFDQFRFKRLDDAYQKMRFSSQSTEVMSIEEWMSFVESSDNLPEGVLPYVWD